MLAGYALLSASYSLGVKRLIMLDVVVLAGLYGVRLAAGGVVFGVVLSAWFIAFSGFLFLALALAKRITELAGLAARGGEAPVGRGYRLDDLPMLESLAAAAALVAVLVLALYIKSPEVAALYRVPALLWLCCPLLLHWLGRILILAHRGTLPGDPVVFAVSDPMSLAGCGLMAAAVAVAAL